MGPTGAGLVVTRAPKDLGRSRGGFERRGLVCRSGGPLVFVDEAAEDVPADGPAAGGGRCRAGERLLEVEPAVGPSLVVVADVVGKHGLEMSSGYDEEVIEAVLPHGAHEPLGERVRPR